MNASPSVGQRSDLTFKHNIHAGRHGWLRLTPAYSVKLVGSLLDRGNRPRAVIDPFSGTGTTGVVAAEQGLNCDLYEINPFLVWLATVKTRSYSEDQLSKTAAVAEAIAAGEFPEAPHWSPPIRDIGRWWSATRLEVLSGVFAGLESFRPKIDTSCSDLLRVAFCRTVIEWSNAAFNHQSMSFKEIGAQALLVDEEASIRDYFLRVARRVVEDASVGLGGSVVVHRDDSRVLSTARLNSYDVLITSPPYPNRISYIREVRPYMYWLGFLSSPRESGELDWASIGGTWGIATSRLTEWKPKGYLAKMTLLQECVERISARSVVLANYVHKYFEDMHEHFRSLRRVLVRGARVHYVVGNSKFYDTVLPTESIYEELLLSNGFADAEVEVTRKRNSKKELYEFVVSATLSD